MGSQTKMSKSAGERLAVVETEIRYLRGDIAQLSKKVDDYVKALTRRVIKWNIWAGAALAATQVVLKYGMGH